MRNIRLTLAYDGTGYVGWQSQPNGVSIQSKVCEAIEAITRERVTLLAAGRTDSGVHALGQVANFRTESRIPCDNFRTGLQNFLPDDIVVRQAEEVPLDFHATYSARQKRYRYVIHNSRTAHPFLSRYVWRRQDRLDARAMHEAAQVLQGTHDFRSFESEFPNKATSVRTVREVSVRRYAGWPLWTWPGSLHDRSNPTWQTDDEGEFICLEIVADGFLYNMVRAIVGTLLRVGQGRWKLDDVRRILEQQDRRLAGETAPPQGLYLVSVDY